MSTSGEVIQRLRTTGDEPRSDGAGNEKGGNGEMGFGVSPDSTPSTSSGRNSWDSPHHSPETTRAQHAAPLQEDVDVSWRKDGESTRANHDALLQEVGPASPQEVIDAARRKDSDVSTQEVVDALQKKYSIQRTTPPKISFSRHLNDFYHSLKIIEMHGSEIRYCKNLGGFLRWTGRRWKPDETNWVWQWAVDSALQMYKDGNGDASLAGNPHVQKWALRSLSCRRIEDALKHLGTETKIVTTADEYDRDPWLFNVENGTIDLRTGELRAHRREDLITKLAPVEFNPACERPRLWEQFLTDIFGGDTALIEFVQRVCGYALTGSVSEQKLFFLYGSGANGKTTFLETLMSMAGDYARRLAPSLLFANSRDRHPTGLADLKGRRLAVTTEVEFGRRLAEAVVKELTGGDRLTARRMHRDYFEFEPTHKIFMCGNHLPIIRGTDHAIWRRIVLIPFGVTIPEERRDKDLCGKLRAEAAGILNWLVTGCLEWQKKGLGESSGVAAATRGYRNNMDMAGVFLNERCVFTPNALIVSADLYQAYDKWCEKNGEDPMNMSLLGAALKEHGLKQKRTKKERMWQGICLKGKRA